MKLRRFTSAGVEMARRYLAAFKESGMRRMVGFTKMDAGDIKRIKKEAFAKGQW